MTVLSTTDLRKIYGSGESEVHALDGVDLSVERGEFVAVVGTSGSGKSTLLHMLGGLDRPTSGKVEVDGKDIFTLGDEELTIFRRRKIGFVFQNYNLVPVLNVYENILLPVQLDGGTPDKKYIDALLKRSDLKASCKIFLTIFREVSSRELLLREHLLQSLQLSLQMSLRAILTARPLRTFLDC